MAISKNSILASESEKELPSPVAMSIGDEIIWSANTGRTSNGDAVGTVIAEKKTVTITWGVLTAEEIAEIEKGIPKGFVGMYVLGKYYKVYRGTLTKEVLGNIGDGKFYYRSASTDIVER